MKGLFQSFKRSFLNDPVALKLYFILYIVGVFIGCASAFLLRGHFSSQIRLIFNASNTPGVAEIYIQQLFFLFLLFLIGLSALCAPLLLLYPLYKGFSLGLIISLSVILFGFKGLVVGFVSFAPQNIYYNALGFLICYSSAKLSITLTDLIRGGTRGRIPKKAIVSHIICLIVLVTLLIPCVFWEHRIVPILLELY